MLKRQRINLASIIIFAKKICFNIENPDNITYIIIDGLDEKLFLINQWKKIQRKDEKEKKDEYEFIINRPNINDDLKKNSQRNESIIVSNNLNLQIIYVY